MSKDEQLKRLKNTIYGYSLEHDIDMCEDCGSECNDIDLVNRSCCICNNYEDSDYCSHCFDNARATEIEAWQIERFFEGSR